MDNNAVSFEENYIFRNNRSITSNNDIALTEFVAKDEYLTVDSALDLAPRTLAPLASTMLKRFFNWGHWLGIEVTFVLCNRESGLETAHSFRIVRVDTP